jgi:trehalose 6-phosphate phosphatase
VIVEDKGASLAIHYRLSPASEPAIRALLRQHEALLARGLEVLESKLAFDIKPRRFDKGTAVDRFMQVPPFRGRRPLFVGDDATDRDGFVAALKQGGDALQIGPRASDVAPWFLPSPATFRAWIGRIAMPGAVVRHQDG